MKTVKWIRQYVFVCGALFLCACSTTSAEYADVMDRKIAQVQLETKEPITTLAFVQTKKLEEPQIQIVKEEQASPQDIETAAGGDDAVKGKIY